MPGGGAEGPVRWLRRRPHARPRRLLGASLAASLPRKALAALAVGAAFGACLPPDAVAPAASAHDRIDLAAPLAPALAADPGAGWHGLPVPEETPSTTDLIVSDLDRLRLESRGEADREQASLEGPSLDDGSLDDGSLDDGRLDDGSLRDAALAGWTLEAPGSASPAGPRGEEAAEEGRSGEAPRDGAAEVVAFGDKRLPRPLVETIVRAARETEVDPAYLMALADKESSFSPTARAATSSAEGLFQFLTGTWLELVRNFGTKHGLSAEADLIERRGSTLTVSDETSRRRVLALRRDPYVASLMAGELMKRDRARVEQRLGRDLKRTECYFAHLLGAASAGKFMALTAEKPDQPAQRAFRAAARANRSLFFARDGKKTRSLTVAEVYERLDDMIDRRLDLFQPVAALAARLDPRRPGEAPTAALSLLP
ncbi:transglycosylase SLT domain-containing protein [Methylobacterium crusticola]|uniref:transglycosylase SLT domain-containing protein n=1 Tax=Methylobacterium crusticola TaxID=1697972 RepID=UPI001EE1CDB4|nr:transglycosylase SLT domain-containing protein [Methylobacterium crusticola]